MYHYYCIKCAFDDTDACLINLDLLQDCGEVTGLGVSSFFDCVALEVLFLRHNVRYHLLINIVFSCQLAFCMDNIDLSSKLHIVFLGCQLM